MQLYYTRTPHDLYGVHLGLRVLVGVGAPSLLPYLTVYSAGLAGTDVTLSIYLPLHLALGDPHSDQTPPPAQQSAFTGCHGAGTWAFRFARHSLRPCKA